MLHQKGGGRKPGNQQDLALCKWPEQQHAAYPQAPQAERGLGRVCVCVGRAGDAGTLGFGQPSVELN